MLDMLANVATQAASDPIYWRELGLQPGIDLGFFTLRYYSLAYILGAFFVYWHTSRMIKEPGAPMAQVHVDDLFFYCLLGIIIGGRIGYLTFYEPSLWTDFSGEGLVSWKALRMWDGGMSFHGGLAGVVAAIGYVCWRAKLPFIRVADYVSVGVGMGMLLGRLANFVNGELWGRPVESDVPWAMIFPTDPQQIARHPSQLYQAGMEGLLVLIVMLCLFWFTRARYRPGLLVGTFTALISTGRFIGEFFRQPDAQLLEFAQRTGLSMGQWLTIPLILLGLALIAWSLTRPAIASAKGPVKTKAVGRAKTQASATTKVEPTVKGAPTKVETRDGPPRR